MLSTRLSPQSPHFGAIRYFRRIDGRDPRADMVSALHHAGRRSGRLRRETGDAFGVETSFLAASKVRRELQNLGYAPVSPWRLLVERVFKGTVNIVGSWDRAKAKTSPALKSVPEE